MFKDMWISPCDDYYDCKTCENSTIWKQVESKCKFYTYQISWTVKLSLLNGPTVQSCQLGVICWFGSDGDSWGEQFPGCFSFEAASYQGVDIYDSTLSINQIFGEQLKGRMLFEAVWNTYQVIWQH